MASAIHGNDFNRRIIEEFRANDGRVGGELAGTTVILVHHVGARTGTVRIVPLISTPLGDGRHMIVASNGGSASHPAWYHNLRAHPVVTVEVGVRTFVAQADELGPSARADRWPQLVAASPTLGEFQARTRRLIPVLILTPLPGWGRGSEPARDSSATHLY
jgi:deazaflavin-dependent oxidoreductase (nitroreductase family)